MTTSESRQASEPAGVHAAGAETPAPETKCGDVATTVAVVGVVTVGALIFEAALIPGIILGVGAMLAPKVFPRIGEGLQPAFRATVRGAYKAGRKARHAFAEAQEQVHDVVAEANAESAAKEV